MRRNLLWLLATLTIVVLLFGYRTSRDHSTEAMPAIVLPSQAASSASPSTGASAGASPKASASPQVASATYTGDVAETQWGEVQVTITVAGGKITAVDVPVYPQSNGRDAQINAYALPALVQETLSAQSANIDMVSGGTVTSGGYVQSLQSAIDKAGL